MCCLPATAVTGEAITGDKLIGLFNEPTGFAHWQPRFDALDIPVFPASREKKPAVRGYLKTRMAQSRAYASGNFASAEAFGIACGTLSGITVLDIDSPDENHVVDAMAMQGKTPFVVQTQSGGHHLYYRHDDEPRAIRPWGDHPFDQLGSGGFVMAPYSQGIKGAYRIAQGRLEYLANLPTIEDAFRPSAIESLQTFDGCKIEKGTRNNKLFTFLMQQAHYVENLAELIDVANTWANGMFVEPLPEDEIAKTAKSVLKITAEGENRIGKRGVWFEQKHVASLVNQPHLWCLVGWLKSHNKPDSAGFMVADGMREIHFPKWSRQRFTDTRKLAIETGWIVKVRDHAQGRAALYRWGPARLA